MGPTIHQFLTRFETLPNGEYVPLLFRNPHVYFIINSPFKCQVLEANHEKFVKSEQVSVVGTMNNHYHYYFVGIICAGIQKIEKKETFAPAPILSRTVINLSTLQWLVSCPNHFYQPSTDHTEQRSMISCSSSFSKKE